MSEERLDKTNACIEFGILLSLPLLFVVTEVLASVIEEKEIARVCVWSSALVWILFVLSAMLLLSQINKKHENQDSSV